MNRKGFTLIELLIVVVIIGILAAIAIPKFANTKEKAYLGTMKSDLRKLVTAEEAYFADSVKYTAAYGAGGINFVQSTGNTTPAVTTTADGWYVFFFQAEDGIRDVAVTGVQTCALPI